MEWRRHFLQSLVGNCAGPMGERCESGIGGYPWRRFLIWDVLGEVLWVVLYVGIGYAFSNRVQAIAEILGNLTWVMLGLIVAVILGWQLARYVRAEEIRS